MLDGGATSLDYINSVSFKMFFDNVTGVDVAESCQNRVVHNLKSTSIK